MPNHRFTLYGETTYIIPRATLTKTTRLPKEIKVYFNPFFIVLLFQFVFYNKGYTNERNISELKTNLRSLTYTKVIEISDTKRNLWLKCTKQLASV